jgi:hypothetical protein
LTRSSLIIPILKMRGKPTILLTLSIDMMDGLMVTISTWEHGRQETQTEAGFVGSGKHSRDNSPLRHDRKLFSPTGLSNSEDELLSFPHDHLSACEQA